MEELLKKLVNLGIGAAKSLEDNLHTAFKAAEQGLNDLIARGEANGESGAENVRKFVNDLSQSVKDYEIKAREISESLIAALREVQSNGTASIAEIQAKLDQITRRIKSSMPGEF